MDRVALPRQATHGDWVLVPLAEYTPEVEREVREAQREQARQVLAELGLEAEVVEAPPRVVLAWYVEVGG